MLIIANGSFLLNEPSSTRLDGSWPCAWPNGPIKRCSKSRLSKGRT